MHWRGSQWVAGDEPPPTISPAHSASCSPSHSPAGPHLSGLVNAAELPGHLHGGGGGSWERVLGLGRGREARGRLRSSWFPPGSPPGAAALAAVNPGSTRAHPRQGPPRLLAVGGVPCGVRLLGEPRRPGEVRAPGPLGSRLPSPRLLPGRPRGGPGSGRGALLLPVAPRFLGSQEKASHPRPSPGPAAAASHQSRYLPLGLRLVFPGWDAPNRLGGCLHLDDRTAIHVWNSLRTVPRPSRKLPDVPRPSSNQRCTGL